MLPCLSSLTLDEGTDRRTHECCEEQEDEDVGVLMTHAYYTHERIKNSSESPPTPKTYEQLVTERLRKLKQIFVDMQATAPAKTVNYNETTYNQRRAFIKSVAKSYRERLARYMNLKNEAEYEVNTLWAKLPESERMKNDRSAPKKEEVAKALAVLLEEWKNANTSLKGPAKTAVTKRKTDDEEKLAKLKEVYDKAEKEKKEAEYKEKQELRDALAALDEMDWGRDGAGAPPKDPKRKSKPTTVYGSNNMEAVAKEVQAREAAQKKKESMATIKEMEEALRHNMPLSDYQEIKAKAETQAQLSGDKPWVNNDTMSPLWRQVNAALAAQTMFEKVIDDMATDPMYVVCDGIDEDVKKLADVVKHEGWNTRFLVPMVKHIEDIITLPGACDLKAYAASLISNALYQQISTTELNRNALFLGPAGIGKTTGAELVGKVLHSLGLVHYEGVSKISASELLGSYAGETPKKVLSFILDQTERVAVLDEVYQLAQAAPFGTEAINQLVYAMSTYSGAHTIYATGYARDVESMLKQNEGFSRRWSTRVNFAPYSDVDMAQILNYQLREKLGRSHDGATKVLGDDAERGLLWLLQECGGRRGEPGSESFEKPRDEDPWLYTLMEDWADSMQKLATSIVEAGYERRAESTGGISFLTDQHTEKVTMQNLVDGIVKCAYDSGKAMLRIQARRLYEGKLREDNVQVQSTNESYRQTLPLVDIVSQLLAYPGGSKGEPTILRVETSQGPSGTSLGTDSSSKRDPDGQGDGRIAKSAKLRERRPSQLPGSGGFGGSVEANQDVAMGDATGQWQRTTIYETGFGQIDTRNGEYTATPIPGIRLSKNRVILRRVMGHDTGVDAAHVSSASEGAESVAGGSSQTNANPVRVGQTDA